MIRFEHPDTGNIIEVPEDRAEILRSQGKYKEVPIEKVVQEAPVPVKSKKRKVRST